MIGRTYLGPADVFVYSGKEYHPGDVIPMTDPEIAHHEANGGHRFAEKADTAVVKPVEKPADADPKR